MSTQKKLVTAQFYFSAAKELDGDFKQFFNESPSSADIQKFLQRRYEVGGRAGEISVEIDGSIAKLRWILATVVSEAEILHKNALQKARLRQYAEAIEKWTKAIQLNPSDPDYYFNVGIAFFEEKRYQEAIENLRTVIRLCPIYHKAHLILGTVYFKMRKFADAEVHLRESLFFNPQNSLALLNLAAIYSILKQYDLGITTFKKIINLNGNEPRAYFGLGKIYSIQGKISEANECFRKVVEFDNKGVLAQHAKRAIITDSASTSFSLDKASFPSSEQSQGEISTENAYAEGYKAYLFGDYQNAIAFFQTSLKKNQDDDYFWFSLGEALLRVGALKDSVSVFKNAIKRNPSKALYFKQLAVAYDFLGKPELAVENLEKTVRLGKKDSIIYMIWGKCLLKMNQVLDAIDKLQTALKLNRANIAAEYFLALAYSKNTENRMAIEHLTGVINAKVKSPLKMEAEKLMERIKSQ